MMAEMSKQKQEFIQKKLLDGAQKREYALKTQRDNIEQKIQQNEIKSIEIKKQKQMEIEE